MRKDALHVNPTLGVLAEPTRLHIVELLADGPLTVNEITTRLDIRQPQVSKHLRVLADAGIVEAQAIANRRLYRLRPEPFQELDRWLATNRQLWEGRFDRLETNLQRLQQDTPPTSTDPRDPTPEP